MPSSSDLIADLIVAAVVLGVPVIFLTIIIGPLWLFRKKRGKFLVRDIVIALAISAVLLWLYGKALVWGLAWWQGQAFIGIYGDKPL